MWARDATKLQSIQPFMSSVHLRFLVHNRCISWNAAPALVYMRSVLWLTFFLLLLLSSSFSLLSMSKDNTVRLWNTKTLVAVAVFGGERGHREQVLTAEFNTSGTSFVSAGMDHCLKVWTLENKKLKEVCWRRKGV